MTTDDAAGHGPDDPLTATERAELLAWARGHPDAGNHVAAVFVLRYEAALTAAEQARDHWHQAYRDLFAEIQEERAETTRTMIGWQHKAEAAEQRAARLGALAQAARAYRTHRDYRARDALFARLDNLDAPPGENQP